MSRKNSLRLLRLFLIPAAVSSLCAPVTAQAQSLAPYKDELFSNQNRKVIETRDNGSYRRYDWDEMRDVNGEDQIPGQVAKPERTEAIPESSRKSIVFRRGERALDTIQVGEPHKAKFAVIFIHGADGNKTLGASDVSFGGNFNRIQNLALRNGGVYYSPTVTFDDQGDQAVAHLIKHIRSKSHDAKIVIACGSAGAHTCWSMAENRETAPLLSGIIQLGGARNDPNFTNSPAFMSRVPVIISHGTADRLVPVSMAEDQYTRIHSYDSKYPIRFESYQGGKHGTPMRQIDWKESLQWLFSHSTEVAPSEFKNKNLPSTVD